MREHFSTGWKSLRQDTHKQLHSSRTGLCQCYVEDVSGTETSPFLISEDFYALAKMIFYTVLRGEPFFETYPCEACHRKIIGILYYCAIHQ